AYLAMSRIYERLNRNEEYFQAALTARQLFESSGNDNGVKLACWDEGWALYKLRRWTESVEASECALRIDPLLGSVRFNLGVALLRLGEIEWERKEYEKGMELNDAASLKTAGINDLTAALEEEPQLIGAREMLQQLESK